ncbi:unnamed protein product [Orchesella dallaii]|uniref:Uncharacterized protein n=1 Tax=Orchesella dallaii TaxID=48710 RepID=A0ABP1RCE8_9HEXA
MPLQDPKGSAQTISSFRTLRSKSGVSMKQSVLTSSPTNDDENQRIPLTSDPSGIYSVLITDSDMALTKRKFVKVSSIGEVEVSPDRVEFCIQITSTKPDMVAARESIRKRDDFIMLALKKLGVPDKGISTASMVKRYKLEDEAEDDDNVLEVKILRDFERQMANGNGADVPKDPMLDVERMKVVKELYVVCQTMNQYMELFSIINEKLDHQVNVSPPVIRITPQSLQFHSQAAAKLAMNNATQKATELLQSQKNIKATVGKLFYSVEDSLTISDIAEYQNISTSTTFETLRWKRNNKLIVCKLTSLFEVNTVKPRRVL